MQYVKIETESLVSELEEKCDDSILINLICLLASHGLMGNQSVCKDVISHTYVMLHGLSCKVAWLFKSSLIIIF